MLRLYSRAAMHHRRLVLPLLVLAMVGCKKSDDAGTPAEQAAKVETICNRMNELSLAYVAGVLEIEVKDLDDATKTKLRTACKELPLDVAQCADRLALDDAKCDKALEKFLGMTDTTPQGEGPAPSWVLTVPFEVYDMEVGADGRVAIAGDKELALVDGGEVKWSVAPEDYGSRVTWWKDHVIAGAGTKVVAYDGSGTEAWSVEVPTEASWLSAIEAGPDAKITAVTSAGEIVRIDGAVCASDTAAEGCITTVGTVEPLGGMSVEVLEGGALLGSKDTGIALVSAEGQLLAERAADYDAGLPRGGLIVAGKDALRADPSCEAGSESCFAVLASAKDMELVAPLRMGEGLVHADTYGVIISTGANQWKIDAGNDADLLSDGTSIYSVGHQLGLDSMDAPPQVRAVDPSSGKTKWITKLGTERAGLLSGYIVELHEGTLLVSTKKQLFALPVGG